MLRLLLLVLLVVAAPAVGNAQGDQITWGVHISLAPTWFDPAEASGTTTPYMIYYAIHDAVVKAMPDQALAPSLAESGLYRRITSHTTSSCARAYAFTTASPSQRKT